MLSEDMAEAAEREYPILDKIYEDQMVIRVSGKRVEFDSVKFVRCRTVSYTHLTLPTTSRV